MYKFYFKNHPIHNQKPVSRKRRKRMTDMDQGICAVCGKTATMRCGNCKLEFYCQKEHQRNDWSRHKSRCRAWEERENAELGRHLLAARDLNPGDLIVSESPIVWGPASHTEERICVGCGAQNAFLRCPTCSWPSCHFNCEGLFDDSRHGFECALLAKARIIPR